MNAKGIAARNAYTNSDSGTQYGSPKTYKGSYSYYQNLYAQENGSGINTTTLKTDGIGRSDKYYGVPTTETYSQASTSGLTVTQDEYSFDRPSSYFDDSNFYSMVFRTGSSYWLASRCTDCSSFDNKAYFGLLRVSGYETLGGNQLFGSTRTTIISDYYLRPVVSLGSDVVDTSLGKDANGAWQIKSL